MKNLWLLYILYFSIKTIAQKCFMHMFLNESLMKQNVKWNGVLWELHQNDQNQLIMTCQVFPYLTSLFTFRVIYFAIHIIFSCNLLLFISVNDIPSLLILNMKFLLPESRMNYDLLGKLYIRFQVPEIMPCTILVSRTSPFVCEGLARETSTIPRYQKCLTDTRHFRTQ